MFISLARALVACLLALTVHSGAATAQSNAEFRQLNQRIGELSRTGRNKEAIELGNRVLELATSRFGADHPKVANLLLALGEFNRRVGNFRKAEHHLRRAFAILEQAHGHGHPSYMQWLGKLASIVESQGRFDEAERLYRLGLAYTARAKGDEHPDVAVYYTSLAKLHRQTGKSVLAEPLLKRALKIQKTTVGENHPAFADALANLAQLYQNQGRMAEGESLFRKSLAINEKALGSSHINVADSHNNLGVHLLTMGRQTDAKQHLLKSVRITEQRLGLDHPSLAQSLSNLGALNQQLKQYHRARQHFRRSLAIYTKSFGNSHPKVAETANNLAVLDGEMGRFDEAQELFELTLRIWKKQFGESHPQVAASMNNLAALYAKQKRYKDAIRLFRRSLVIRKAALGPDHELVASTLSSLAATYNEVGNHAEEEELRQHLRLMPPAGTRQLRLYFATNRRTASPLNFTADIAPNTSFGQAIMRVPKKEVANLAKRVSENTGLLEQAKTGKLTTATSLKLVSIKSFENLNAATTTAQSSQRRAAIFKNQALVFVHGYNNSFEGAMQRATQLSFDLQFDGILIPFAWPSQGTLTGYLADGQAAEKSIQSLIALLRQLRQQMPATKIHLLAHSMGNQIMLPALCKIAKQSDAAPGSDRPFGQIISAHPDISPKDFERLTACFKPLTSGTTLYVNEKDTALRARCAGFRCRAGNFARGYTSADVIDTTSMGKGFWKALTQGLDHDVFVRNPLLFADITRLLLAAQRPVHQRTPEFRQQKDKNGNLFWAYDKTRDVAFQPQPN